MSEKKIITAAELMARAPAVQDVWCESWQANVRLRRLSGPEKLRVVLRLDALEKDDQGKVRIDRPENWAFAVDSLAESIVDEAGALQFSEPESRGWLAGELQAVSELLGPALKLNGIGETEQLAEQEAAKNG